MSLTPTINSLDLLKGCCAKVEVASWNTNYTATPFFDLGALRDIAIEGERTVKTIEADNYIGVIDAYPTKTDFKIKGTMLEADLRKFAFAMGDATTTPSATTYYIDENASMQYWTVKLTVTNQSMKPLSTTYDTRTYTFPRCVVSAKTNMSFKKDSETVVPFECQALLDTSVTAGAGQIGKVVDAT